MTNFEPIIHNLTPTDKGYKEVQLYNALVGNKPKGNYILSNKIAMQRAWKDLCGQALEAASAVLNKAEGK